MIESIQKYWAAWLAAIAFLGSVAYFGADIKAIAMAPEQLEETSEQVQKTAHRLELYATSNQEINKRQDALIELLAQGR